MLSSIGLLLVLTALNAVFASAEIAVISTSEARLKMLEQQGSKPAKRLLSLTKQPAKFLATIQVAITLAGLLSSAFAAENLDSPWFGALALIVLFAFGCWGISYFSKK